jgi:hypothetical protein
MNECRHGIASQLTLDRFKGTYNCDCGAYDVGWEVADKTLALVLERDEARAALAKAQEEIASLRRVNHRRLCGCEESAGVFGCGLNCPCRCHALHEMAATARAEALEEAAKVVDDLDMPDMWDGSIGRTDDGSAFRRNAVAAIRALAQDTKGET